MKFKFASYIYVFVRPYQWHLGSVTGHGGGGGGGGSPGASNPPSYFKVTCNLSDSLSSWKSSESSSLMTVLLLHDLLTFSHTFNLCSSCTCAY